MDLDEGKRVEPYTADIPSALLSSTVPLLKSSCTVGLGHHNLKCVESNLCYSWTSGSMILMSAVNFWSHIESSYRSTYELTKAYA